jgi:hypothetical protein
MKEKDLKYFYKYQTINSKVLKEDRTLEILFNNKWGQVRFVTI